MLKRFPLQIGKSAKSETGRNVGVFWAGDPLKVNFKAPNPQKARVRNRTRRLSYQACESVKNCDL